MENLQFLAFINRLITNNGIKRIVYGFVVLFFVVYSFAFFVDFDESHEICIYRAAPVQMVLCKFLYEQVFYTTRYMTNPRQH